MQRNSECEEESVGEWKEVSEAEMRQFIADYPRRLIFSTCFIIEPPTATFNDVVNGEAIPVAEYYDDYLDGNKRHCFIRVKDGE